LWITIEIGKEFSLTFLEENGAPQGSIVSPDPFSIMMNEVFSKVERSISAALFADDVLCGKREEI